MAAKRGIDPRYGQYAANFITAAGLRNIYAREANVVAGPTSGRLGIMQAQDILAAYRGLSAIITRNGVVATDVYDQTMQQMEIELNKGEVIWPTFQAIGQKH